MLASLLRLLALRPLLAASIMGVPLLVVFAAGLATVWVFKVVAFVIPFVVAWWLLRALFPARRETTMHTA